MLAVFSMLVSDMHTIPDLILALPENTAQGATLPAGIEFPYLITGLLAGPIMVIAISLFGAGFIGAWQITREKLAFFSGIAAFGYGAAAIFAAFADIHYAAAVAALQANGDLNLLTIPGTVRGISALLMGVIGGLVMTICMGLYFRKRGHRTGFVGAALALTAIIAGILVKTLALWFLPYYMMGAFLILMGIKSVGITLMSLALYQQIKPNR